MKPLEVRTQGERPEPMVKRTKHLLCRMLAFGEWAEENGLVKDTQKMRQRGRRKVRRAAFAGFMGRGMAALNVAKGQASKGLGGLLDSPVCGVGAQARCSG